MKLCSIVKILFTRDSLCGILFKHRQKSPPARADPNRHAVNAWFLVLLVYLPSCSTQVLTLETPSNINFFGGIKVLWKFSTSPHKQNVSWNKDLHSSTLPSYPMTVAVPLILPSSKGDLSLAALNLRTSLPASWQTGLHGELSSQEYTSFKCWFSLTNYFNLLLRNISFSIRDEFYHLNAEQL